jgi:signal transduction histidine kinase
VDGRAVEFNPEGAAPLSIRPGYRRIEIDYAAVTFTTPEKARYRYRLESRDKDWIDAGVRRSTVFDGLSPGEYKFHVIGANRDGVWNESGASLRFIAGAYFWQTSWFKAAVAAGLLAGTALTVRAVSLGKVRRRLELLERKNAINTERSRIARDMHDDVGASLTRLTMLSNVAIDEIGQRDETEANLRQLALMSREAVTKLDELVWTVNPKHDSPLGLVEYMGQHLSEFVRGRGLSARFDFDLAVSTALTAEVRHQVFLVFKEAVNNAVKHGHPREIWLRARTESGMLIITVDDDGCGFDPSAEASGDGMANMRQRMISVGGSVEWVATPGQGAHVILKIPLPP